MISARAPHHDIPTINGPKSLRSSIASSSSRRRCDPVPVSCGFEMADSSKMVMTAAEMDKMTPQQRTDAVTAATAQSWEEVPEPFQSEVLATARALGEQRRKRD